MGRPINKNRMSVTTGGQGVAGKIEVTGYFPAAGSLLQDDDAYIVKQRSSRKFQIHQANSTLEIMTLTAVAPASLTAGQFCVKVRLSDSTVGFVEKFYNNIIHFKTTAGDFGKAKYTLGSAAAEDTPGASGVAVIDVI